MNKRDRKEEVWIGLVHVTPLPGSTILGDDPGAWVNILALAANERDYRVKVYDAVSYYSLELREIENPEPLRSRTARTSVDSELLLLADEVRQTGFARFGTFHMYTQDDAQSN